MLQFGDKFQTLLRLHIKGAELQPSFLNQCKDRLRQPGTQRNGRSTHQWILQNSSQRRALDSLVRVDYAKINLGINPARTNAEKIQGTAVYAGGVCSKIIVDDHPHPFAAKNV